MEFVYLKEMVSDFGCVLKNAIEDGFTIYVRASSFDSNKVFLRVSITLIIPSVSPLTMYSIGEEVRQYWKYRGVPVRK